MFRRLINLVSVGLSLLSAWPALAFIQVDHRSSLYIEDASQSYIASGIPDWLSRDPLQESGGINLTQAFGNDPVNNVDPLGLAVYLVYRELGVAPGTYLDGKQWGAGHVYLAFDDQNVDKEEWGKLVTELGDQKTPIRRDANPVASTFSFHPRAVLEEQLGIMEHPDNLAGTLFTASSFIGYNDDEADVQTFLNAKTPGSFPKAAKAKIFKVATTPQQQFDLYRKVQEIRVKINVEKQDVCGTYKLGVNNCGSWAVKMIRSQKLDVPKGFSNLNLFGTGIGGVQDYLPVTYLVTGGAMAYGYGNIGVQATYSAGKTAAAATGQGIYWTGNKAKELVESSGGEFYVAPIDGERGAGGAGIRWNF